MLIINIILALIVGVPAWLFSLSLGVHGAPVLGNLSTAEVFLWWAPVLCAFFPGAVLALTRSRLGLALWLLALAPYCAALNLLIATAAHSYWPTALWSLLLLYVAWSIGSAHFKQRRLAKKHRALRSDG